MVHHSVKFDRDLLSSLIMQKVAHHPMFFFLNDVIKVKSVIS